MSKTIRNEKTRGYLDKLQKERESRRLIRDIKSLELQDFIDSELSFYTY